MSQAMNVFHQFQSELDMRNDKLERLIKISRDITISSKRAIFLIHRINSGDDKEQITSEVHTKLKDLEQTKWLQVAKELVGEDSYQFLRAYSPGLQEYVEALALLHYITHQSLIRLSDVKQRLSFTEDAENQSMSKNVISVCVPPSEYLMGIADIAGELMRIAVHCFAVSDTCNPRDICMFLRDLNTELTSHPLAGRDVQQKLTALKQSIAKVETVCYTLHVRGSELPQHLLAGALQSQPSSGIYEVTAADDRF